MISEIFFKTRFAASMIPTLVIIGLFLSMPAFNSGSGVDANSDTLYNVQYYRLNLVKDNYEYLYENKLWDEFSFTTDTSLDQRDAIIRRLTITGDITYLKEFKDSVDLHASLQNFQVRHGLKTTGLADKETVKELNISISDRIKSLEINIERFRKVPSAFTGKLIIVNTADYKLRLMDKINVQLEMDVIIGRTYRKTPEFSAELTHIVFNPDWIIPPTILRVDVLPKVRKDVNYLSRNGIAVYKANKDGSKTRIDPYGVNWRQISTKNFPYQFVQKPGVGNPLGVVKFIFPNKYNVYMHDTPDKELFEKDVKTFSSGCIRLSDAIALAENLLEAQDWDSTKIQSAVISGKTQTVYLEEPVPVFISYYTCWVDDNGKVHFRKDIYSRDIQYTL